MGMAANATVGSGCGRIRGLVDKEFVMSQTHSTRVGLLLSPSYWLGGRNYLRNLFAAIQTLPDLPITPVLFAGRRQGDVSADFPGIEVVRTSLLDIRSPEWFVRRILAKVSRQDILLRKLLERNNVSVLSHAYHLGRQTSIKTIGWIPDFQHVHLPEFFTQEECLHRDSEFMGICAGSDKVIVSSDCARADLRAFSPTHAHKAELLHFVASPVPLAHAATLPELQQLYSFEGPYFLLPNQFWAHKNHRVVLDALQILKQRNQPFLVLATGSPQDYRNPSFYPSLVRHATNIDVLDCFRILGQIPFDHLAGLMRHAVAFINPSRFEGWSTSVEEAKSMGKQVVLSDIPVHREQAPERGFFFADNVPEALADAMQAAFNGFDIQQDAVMQDEANARFLERQQEFAKAYCDIMKRLS
jgi:glycosyltransferase involved in cell wall biosynthesis